MEIVTYTEIGPKRIWKASVSGVSSPTRRKVLPQRQTKGRDASKYRWLLAGVLAAPFDGSPEEVRWNGDDKVMWIPER
jgi:hypothetical protein